MSTTYTISREDWGAACKEAAEALVKDVEAGTAPSDPKMAALAVLVVLGGSLGIPVPANQRRALEEMRREQWAASRKAQEGERGGGGNTSDVQTSPNPPPPSARAGRHHGNPARTAQCRCAGPDKRGLHSLECPVRDWQNVEHALDRKVQCP